MGVMGLNKNQYSKFKNLSYQVYMLDHTHASNKAQRVMNEILVNYDNEEIKTIFNNTVLFPFDVELYNFLMSKGGKLNDSIVQLASEKFDIPVEVVSQKASEYITHGFINRVGEGLIDYSVIFELSKQLLEKSSQSEKNQKAS